MSWWLPWVLFSLLPAATLGLGLFNIAVWPRGGAASDESETVYPDRRISVLIPARDEQETIERCVRAVDHSHRPPDEILVYEDRSTDQTPAILARLADEIPALRIVDGEPLPDGWIGKPHACHRLAEEASGDVLVYVDADTELEEGGLARVLSVLESGPAGRADLVTAVPRQTVGTWAESLVVPLLHLTYVSWLPLPLIWRTDDPRFLAANGQLLAVRSEALASVGGFEAIRDEVVDDMALGRAFKRAGRPVVFADGTRMARCRMYDSWSGLWEGFSKNLYEGIGGRPTLLALTVGLYVLAFFAPWIAAPLGWFAGANSVALAAAVGVACNVGLRTALAFRFHHPARSVVCHPVGIAALVAIALNSFLWHRRGEVRWAGRTYPSRGDR